MGSDGIKRLKDGKISQGGNNPDTVTLRQAAPVPGWVGGDKARHVPYFQGL